jgi:phage-related protein
MYTPPEEWQIEYYTDARGKCDVLDYINALQENERRQVTMHLKLLREFGLTLTLPYAKPLKGHKPLWELRPGNNRMVFFAYTGQRFIILHVFRKKGYETPKKHIATAERRMFDFLERERND